MRASDGDWFYVGYLPVPARLRRFLWVLIPALVVALLLTAGVFAARQSDQGDGAWDTERMVVLTGRLTTEPYVVLTVPGVDGGPEREVLLVTMGKWGGEALGLDAGEVTIRGYPIERGAAGTMLLAMESSGGVMRWHGEVVAGAVVEPLGRVTLAGQIIDPKCYFGAMRPGEGKVHKACATLCIRGGIPPMFLTIDEHGERTVYLLLNESGDAIEGAELEALLPYVADPVSVTGELERRGTLLRLRVDPAAFARL